MERKLDNIEDRITLEALESVFKRIPAASYVIIPLPLMVIAVMWSQVDHVLLIGWGLLVLASIIFRYSIAVAFIKNDVHYKEAGQWGRRFSLSSLFSGLIWASSIFLFYASGSLEHQVFIFSLIITLSISSVISGAYWFPAYYLFAVPTISMMTIRLAMEGTLTYYGLAILLLLYLLATVSLTKELRRTMRSEMRLRYESVFLNEQLKIKTEEAEQATLAKSRFLAAASHDLRQPLHTLSLFLDVLKDTKSESERASIFPSIDLSLNSLRKLFDALLDVSRLDADVVKPEFCHFDVAELIKKLAEEFKPAADQKNLKLKVHANSSIIVSDKLLLERVLRNLINNAIRYTASGGILLSCRQRDDQVLLQVWDTGVGIPDKSKEEVFVEFHQLHNSHRDREEGLGLGLALVRRLCGLLKHSLELKSQPGRGSVFSIRILKGSESLLANRRTNARSHSWDLSGRRILVIDDEKDILAAKRALLNKWGCQVVTAESLEDAVKNLNEKNVVPEMILSDLRLRNSQTGIEAMDSLRKQFGESIPGILITGDTDPEQLKLAKQSHYEILQKPVRPAHLRSVIQHYLSAAES